MANGEVWVTGYNGNERCLGIDTGDKQYINGFKRLTLSRPAVATNILSTPCKFLTVMFKFETDVEEPPKGEE
jgi:hypothetical protein